MNDTNLISNIKIGESNLEHLSIINNKEGEPIWDLFQVEIINGAMKRKVEFVAERGIINETISPEILEKFIINRLTGEHNLLEKQGYKDIIFLGTMYQKDGQTRFTRNYNSFYCKNGKNAEKMFEECYDEILPVVKNILAEKDKTEMEKEKKLLAQEKQREYEKMEKYGFTRREYDALQTYRGVRVFYI